MSTQTESMHYYAKRRLDLAEILSRVRGGSSLRDIGREVGCSRTAVANAVVRLGRQAMASHVALLGGVTVDAGFVFDGLVSALTSRDYPTQIQTLVAAEKELVLAMTHCVSERGGVRTAAQRRRIERKRGVWRPSSGSVRRSISLLVHELPRFVAAAQPILIDTDENPLYQSVIGADLAMNWYREVGLLELRQTSSRAARTTGNPLFPVNYIDRMIRHRVKEHTRETIAVGRSATMQMLRMWIFAWDHNVRQPYRVSQPRRCRAIEFGASASHVARLEREFTTRRRSVRGLCVPESIRQVWLSRLESPPVRWRVGQHRRGPVVRQYAKRDLALALPAG